MSTHVVDGELVAVEGPVSIARPVLMEHAPAAVLAEASRAAVALADVIRNKPKPVVMNGEQYLEFEDWQTLGRFYGITARVDGDPEHVDFGTARGFKASAVALCRGEIISRATAFCLSDEEKWGARPKYEYQYLTTDGGLSSEDPGRERIVWEDNPHNPGRKRPKKQRVHVGEEAVPLYQLASMAQTRACAKALRNVLSWVAVLAGYKTTPAEELPADRGGFDGPGPDGSGAPEEPRAERTERPQETRRESAPPRQADPPRQAQAERPAAAPQSRPASTGALPKWAGPCPRCKVVGAVMISKKDPSSYYCFPGGTRAKGCGESFKPGAQPAATQSDLSEYGVEQ